MNNKMKKPIVLLACVLAIGSTIAQNNTYDEAKHILRLSREKCLSIQQGHYVMERKMKFMSDKDTTAERHTCDFRKLPDDTIYRKAFNMTFVPMDEGADWKGHILYTGREKVWISDTTAVIQSCDQWADKIIAGRHNQKFYTPLTEENCHPLPGKNWLADSNFIYSLSETLLDGKPCYRVTYFNTNFDPDTIFGITTIRYEVLTSGTTCPSSTPRFTTTWKDSSATVVEPMCPYATPHANMSFAACWSSLPR